MSLTVTAYRSVRAQTDSSPYYTSTGEHVYAGGVAVSRDLLCGACRRLHRRCAHPEDKRHLHYGDELYVEGVGLEKINDVMGVYTSQRVNGKVRRIPITKHADIWVSSLREEKQFFRKHKFNPVRVWKLSTKEDKL